VKQSEANGRNLHSQDAVNTRFITLLRKLLAKYSSKDPEDQPPFSKRLSEQVAVWEDRSELWP
jgi:hypothetical protein